MLQALRANGNCLRQRLDTTAVGERFEMGGFTYLVVGGANGVKRAVWVRP